MRLSVVGLAVAACALSTVGVAAALASSPAGKAPVTLRVHFSAVRGSVLTDGSYTMITRRSGVRVVLDETTGRRAGLRLPSYCRNPATGPILGDSWLLVGCNGSRLALYSLARRRWRSVAVAPACVHFHAGVGVLVRPRRGRYGLDRVR